MPKKKGQQYLYDEVDDMLYIYTLKIALYEMQLMLFPALFMQSNEIRALYISFDTHTKLFPFRTCCN